MQVYKSVLLNLVDFNCDIGLLSKNLSGLFYPELWLSAGLSYVSLHVQSK